MLNNYVCRFMPNKLKLINIKDNLEFRGNLKRNKLKRRKHFKLTIIKNT